MRTRQVFRKVCGIKTCAKCGISEDDVEEKLQKARLPQDFVDRKKNDYYPFHEIPKGEIFPITTFYDKPRQGFDAREDNYEAKETFALCDQCYHFMIDQLDNGYKKFEFRRFLRKKV